MARAAQRVYVGKMEKFRLRALPLVFASLIGVVGADCTVSSNNGVSDGGLGGAGAGGSTAASCTSELFNNGNTAACTTLTNTSRFTLALASRVTALKLWVNTASSGASLSYTLSGSTGVVSTGAMTTGSCDPYQSNWCEFSATLDVTLPAGTYTVNSSAAATCSNSGSNNVGFVAVLGCAAGSTGAGGSGAMGGGTGAGGAAGLGGVVGGAGNRSCAGTSFCVDYVSFPANYDWTLVQNACSSGSGTLVTTLCSGTYCGTCTVPGGLGSSIATHYLSGCANAQATCGGTYTPY
jgi:hypothetical protein